MSTSLVCEPIAASLRKVRSASRSRGGANLFTGNFHAGLEAFAGLLPDHFIVDGEMTAAPFFFAVIEAVRAATSALRIAVILPGTLVGHGEARALSGTGIFVVLALPLALI
jgi:hypothetical protein